MTRILVIEDDAGIRSNILELLEAEEFEAVGAADGAAGVAEALARAPDLVLCDITMPVLDGYGVLKALSEHDATASVPFVFLSARAERAEIRLGMNLGADDYVTKPYARSDLLEAIRARLERARVRQSQVPERPSSERQARPSRAERPTRAIVLEPRMQAVYDEARRAALGPISILILGETGVGKEVLAHEIHRVSPRARGPFVALNCAALSETLLESELFGHEKGAFTGAAQAKRGLLESADGGTVFLDEVGDLPLSTQVKLLRVLEERRVMRVGGRTPTPVDMRVISATNRDIERDAQRGTFRADLLFRLNGATLTIPPLRERRVEIESLARVFLAAAATELDRPAPRLGPDALARLLTHDWPGNIRELRNAVERAVLMCGGDEIRAEHLPSRLAAGGAAVALAPGRGLAPTTPAGHAPMPEGSPTEAREERRVAVEDVERRQIEDALARCGGNQTQAASMLGISRRTLVSRLSQYAFPRPRRR